MKNVMMLGDSSRILYEGYVRQKLPNVKIETPNENCKFSAYMLNSLRFWLPAMSKPNVIHWGGTCHWDTACLYVDDGPFTPLDEYVRNMNSILRELKKYEVPIIFATGTPVKAEQIKAVATPSIHTPETPTVFKQSNQRIVEYNEAVVALFREQGVIINDLWALINPHKDEYISEDGIHMNEKGVQVLGDAVADAIERWI